jgi:signal transduction histidine kinase/ligand-binding sensor domain-containing protein
VLVPQRSAAVAFLFLALSAGQARALDPDRALSECTVDLWRVREGLPGAWVRALAQTPDGYLWVATVGGLARYDGAQLTRMPSGRFGQRLDDVMDVHLGRDGTLWATPSRGEPVCVRAGVPRDCYPARGTPEGARFKTTFDDGSAVWVAGRDGLYRLANGHIALAHPSSEPPFDRVLAMARDGRGRLWIAGGNGLFVEDNGQFHVHAGINEPIAAVSRGAGAIWALGAGMLVRVSDSGETTIYRERDGVPGGKPGAVLEDRDGNVWIGTRMGLTRLRPSVAGAGRFALFGRTHGLPDEDVTALFEDREGSLWVGTRAGGLAQFSDRTVKTHDGPISLRGEWVETLAEDEAGAFWLGWRHGVVRWKDGAERTFRPDDGLPGDHVLAVLPGGQGELWVGTVGGLGRIKDGHVDTPVPFSEGVEALYRDRAGTLWIGTASGLARVVNGAVERMPLERGLEPAAVRALAEDDRGQIWLTLGAGLARLDGGRIVRVRGPEELGLHRVRALHRDADGTVWMSGRNGLLRLRGGQLRNFGAKEGMPTELLHQILDDDHGALWIGTGRGIVRVTRRSLEEVAAGRRERVDLVSLDTSDERLDVIATRMRQPGAWKDHTGKLWFATDEGIITIDPRHVRLNAVPPPVWIEEVLVDGRPGARGRRFPPGPGMLEVHYGAVTLLEPHKARHRYLLEGFDARWVEAGARRVAYYTNLRPGRYRFRVQARNADGVWNEAGDAFELTLAPHFHQTVWFYALVVLLVAGAVLSLHRLRTARLRAGFAAVIEERGRLARELHDSLLQGMSAVSMQIRGLRKRLGAGAPVAKDLKVIEDVVAENLEETRRFVWNLRESTADEDLAGALSRLVRRLAEGRSVECRVEVDGSAVRLPETVEQEVTRIAQEAVTNALKHAEARHIDVRLCYERGGLKVSVSDDGHGFDPERAHGAPAGHFGLLGMRERAARVGRLTIDSRPGAGTRVEVVVPAEEAVSAHA